MKTCLCHFIHVIFRLTLKLGLPFRTINLKISLRTTLINKLYYRASSLSWDPLYLFCWCYSKPKRNHLNSCICPPNDSIVGWGNSRNHGNQTLLNFHCVVVELLLLLHCELILVLLKILFNLLSKQFQWSIAPRGGRRRTQLTHGYKCHVRCSRIKLCPFPERTFPKFALFSQIANHSQKLLQHFLTQKSVAKFGWSAMTG